MTYRECAQLLYQLPVVVEQGVIDLRMRASSWTSGKAAEAGFEMPTSLATRWTGSATQQHHPSFFGPGPNADLVYPACCDVHQVRGFGVPR